MALATRLSKVGAKAALDALLGELETGTGANVQVEIHTGAQPASPDATHALTRLVEINLGTNPFPAATTGTGTDTNYVRANRTADATGTATNTGTAAWFRAKNRAASPTAVIDGSVGLATGTFDMDIDNTSITSGQQVKLDSWKIRLPFATP